MVKHDIPYFFMSNWMDKMADKQQLVINIIANGTDKIEGVKKHTRESHGIQAEAQGKGYVVHR